MKYSTLMVSMYTVCSAVYAIRNGDRGSMFSGRGIDAGSLHPRGIIRAQHAAKQGTPKSSSESKTSAIKTPPSKQDTSAKSEAARQAEIPKKEKKPKSSTNARVSMDGVGPAGMTTMAEGRVLGGLQPRPGSPGRLSGEHASKVTGLIRDNRASSGASPQHMRAHAQGKVAKVMVNVPAGKTGHISKRVGDRRSSYDVPGGTQFQDHMAVSNTLRGASIEAKVPPPGMIAAEAKNERHPMEF